MSKLKRMLGSKAALALGAWVAYVLAFIPLYRLVGQVVAALAILPAVVTGWLFGIRAGLLTGLLAFPLNMLLTALVTGTAWEMMASGGLFGSVLILLIGSVVGRLHDLGEQVKWELAERKRAEEVLKELVKKIEQAKEEWEFTADSLPELICLVDNRGRIIRANRTVETWNLGRVVDVKGQEVHELLHPDCMDVSCYFDSFWKQAWEGAMRGQPAQCEAYDEVLKRHVLVRYEPWKGEAVGSTVVVVQDITDRKRAEEALKEYSERLEEMVEERTAALKAINEQLRLEITERKRVEEALRVSEERFALAVQGSNDGIWDWDVQNNSLYWSPRLKGLLGYADDEFDVDFDTLVLLLHPDDRGRTEAAIEAHLKDRGLYDVEQRLRTKSGEYRWFRARGQALWDEAGQPLRMVGSTADITERKRAEEALRDEKALMDALMDSIPDSIYFKDRQCRLIRINRKMMRDLNLDEMSQAIGKTDVGLFGEEFGRKTLPEDQRIMATGEPIIGLIESRQLEDGQINWTLTTKVPLRDTSGQIVGLVGITREINELMRAEQSLRESEEQLQRYAAELEQANEEVKQFAYIVSHDLRAPLVNLKGFTTELRFALEAIDSVMETALPHLDGKQRQDVIVALREDVPEALGFINSSVTHMDHFISALLKLSRLGRRELKLELVDMELLVQATLQTLAHQLEERQVEVTVGPLPEMVADRTSMEQIMGNLLGNAVKYLEPDRPGDIEITAERSPDETTFRIRDNGRGIAEEDMDKVFAPFRRIGRQDVPGEGMGLPYVQALVRRHGGRMWCESELGVGTTFSFTISNHIEKGGNDV